MLNHCPLNNRHMKTTFKAIIASELLAVCSETTERQRKDPKEKEARKFSDAEIKAALNAMPNWGAEVKAQLMNVFSILLKAPELGQSTANAVFNLFSVVVCEANINSHPWVKKAPFIIVHSKNQCGLGPDGNMGTYYRDMDKPRLATAEEVVKCIENLSEAQWTKVRSDPMFSPILASAMNMEVVIDENEVVLTEADKQAADEAP